MVQQCQNQKFNIFPSTIYTSTTTEFLLFFFTGNNARGILPKYGHLHPVPFVFLPASFWSSMTRQGLWWESWYGILILSSITMN